MPVELRVASFEGRTGIVQNGVRCGMEWCRYVLGDLVIIGGVRHIELLEGFRKEKNGCYRLHRHARKRLKRGKAPKDAHPRWHGLDQGRWSHGPGAGREMTPAFGPGEVRVPIGLPRERLPARERVSLDQLQVTCPACRFSNTLHGHSGT